MKNIYSVIPSEGGTSESREDKVSDLYISSEAGAEKSISFTKYFSSLNR
jgi:hypothetical protein